MPVRDTHLLSLRLAAAGSCLFFAAAACSANDGGSPESACQELKPEVSALGASYTSNPMNNAKVAAFVQASKDILWASHTLEHDVAAACQRIGADLGLAEHEMKPDKGPGGFASGICNAVSKRFDLIQRSQDLRTWVTVAAPECVPNMNAWARCGTVCNVQDTHCNLLCRAHANVHAECSQAQVRVRPARDGTLPPEIMSTLSANLTSLVHAQIAIGQRLSPDTLAVNQIAATLPKAIGDAGGCLGAGGEVSEEAARRMRTSERAASDLLSRLQGQ